MRQIATLTFLLVTALFSVPPLAGEPSEIVVDYDKMTVTVDGREMPIIIDYPANLDCAGREEFLEGIRYDMTRSDTAWEHLAYNRFDVYIDSVFYYNNTPALDEFWDLFEPRYEHMEALTGWSSEKFYGTKLEIYVNKTSSGCWGGYAIPGEAHLFLSDPFPKEACKRAYYENGTPLLENPGELGDWWGYMGTALHESLHSINPLPIYARLWLTEGWAEYNEFDVLRSHGDINQETMDYYLYNGWAIPDWYNWEDYVANDYHDTTPDSNEIQESPGYDITAWMFSMLRDDYSLNWDDFYTLMDNNQEYWDKLWELRPTSVYYTDTYIIDLFTRTIGQDMYPVFRYDGPEGPGWGVRQWESLDWYADLTPSLSFSWPYPVPGDTIDLIATVYNNGDTDLDSVSVRFYEGVSFIDEQTVSVAANDSASTSVSFSAGEGDYTIFVRVDEDNIKIETNDTNNVDSAILTIFADTDSDGVADVIDNCPDTANPDQTDTDGDGIGDVCDTCTDTDGDGYGNPGYAGNTCAIDNCPDTANPAQEDTDGDGVGDACDECTDTDGDGYGDPGFPANTCSLDNCPDTANPDQTDTDGDGIGDSCDTCTDTDGDGYGDLGFPVNTCSLDNCPDMANPDQADADSNGVGVACCCVSRGDADHGGAINVADPTYLTDYLFFSGPAPPCPEEGDANGNGSINSADPTYLTDYLFFEGPAPPVCP